MADREDGCFVDVSLVLVLVEDGGAWLDPWKESFCCVGGAWEEEAKEEREGDGAEGGPGNEGGFVFLLLRATGGGGGKSMVVLSGGTVFIPLLMHSCLDKKRGD